MNILNIAVLIVIAIAVSFGISHLLNESFIHSFMGVSFFLGLRLIPNLIPVNFQMAILGVLAIAIPASIYLMV